MLKYKINILGVDIARKEIFPKRILKNEDDNTITFEFDETNMPIVRDGDTLFIDRGDGDNIYIKDERYISYKDKKTFTIPYLEDYGIGGYIIKIIDNVYCSGQTFNKGVMIAFTESNKHDFLTIRKSNVREDLNCETQPACHEEEGKDISIKCHLTFGKDKDGGYLYYKDEYTRYCGGDYTINNGIFLMKSIGVNDKGYYIFDESSLKNTKQTLYFYDENNEKVEFECIVPFTEDGDDRSKVYFLYKDGENENIVDSLSNNVSLYTENNKFYQNGDYIIRYYEENTQGEKSIVEIVGDNVKKNDNNDKIEVTSGDITSEIAKEKVIGIYRNLIPHKGTKFYKEYGDFRIKVPIGNAFESNMWQKENIIEQYVGERAQSLINPIVDMEKQVFIPVILDEKGDIICDNVKEITFNFNFLSRYTNGGMHTWKETVKATEDDKKHVKRLEKDANSFTNKDCGNVVSSHLLDLGFTIDDLLYQKMCVKKSFARFSYFNKQSRGSQALLHYSTTYLDSGEIYGLINKGEQCIPCSMSVSNSFNRMKSSEGYYLYLFPNVVDINKDENGWGTIYMKIDFNHAKYGYTIPMSVPNSEELKNDGYIKVNSGTYQSDKKILDNDIYIPIKVRYNSINNRYEWCVEGRKNIMTDDNIITFNLYEPIINYQETVYE